METAKLKVVHVSASYYGGAGRAAIRLHNALLKEGFDSNFVCLEKDLPKDLLKGSSIAIPEKTFLQWQSLRIKYRAKRHLGLNLYSFKETISNNLIRISSALQCEITSLPFSNCALWENQIIQNADVIHLHWVSGILDYPLFFKKNLKPVVWTLHDMNAFHGLFHYKEDELRNREMIENLDKKTVSIKAKAIKNRLSKLTIVSPSRWLLNDALQSKVFEDIQGVCIPNPIDTDVFSPQPDDNLKQRNSIPEENITFLFVAQLVNIYPKGFSLLIAALKQLSHLPITLLVLGESTLDLTIEGLDIRRLDTVNDEIILRNYYAGVDAFITPSRDENLPYVMIESLCCGTPVIGFPVGGIKENIIDYENGLLAEEVNSRSLANAIENFCQNRERFDSEKISQNAKAKFNEHFIAQKYIDVYKNSMNL